MARPNGARGSQPLVGLLTAMGWARHECTGGDGEFGPCRECLLAAVERLNQEADGTCWLTAAQGEAVWAEVLRAAGPPSLTAAANGRLSGLLREGMPAQKLPDWHEGLPALVRLVDWEGLAPGTNDFRLVAQRRVGDAVTPDVLLRVNGLPWVVIAQEPDARGVIDYLVHQIRNLAGTSGDSAPAWPELARYAQLLVVMDESDARLGTITSAAWEFDRWRTVAPATEEQVRAELGCPVERPLRPWEALTAGVLRPSHLLDLVRNFVQEREWPPPGYGQQGTVVKTVARYPQYRAVHRVTDLLVDRMNGRSANTPAWRGGLVRHFTDSGSERTMSFLVRRLRAHPRLAGHKIVVVAQHREREHSIADELARGGEGVVNPPSAYWAAQALALDVPDVLVLTLQRLVAVRMTEQPHTDPEDPPPAAVNTRSNILVILDEPHNLTVHHVRLREILPNAAYLGFADAPVPRRSQATVQHLFGNPVDVYTARDALADGVLRPVLYERAADEGKADLGAPHVGAPGPAVRTSGANCDDLTARAARMFRHWAFTGLRHGVAAQVVAASRADAVRYCPALLKARDQLLADIEALDPDLLSDPDVEDYATEEQRALIALWSYRHVLKRIDPRAAISMGGTEPQEWRRWTQPVGGRAGGRPKGLAEAVAEPPPDPSWGADPHGGATPGAPQAAPRNLTVFTVVQSRLQEVDNGGNGHLVFLDRGITTAELRHIMRARRPGDALHHVVDHADALTSLEQAFARYDADHLREVLGVDEAPHWGLCKDRDHAAAEVLWLVDGKFREFLTAKVPTCRIDTLRAEGPREDLLAALADPLTHARFIGLVRHFLVALNSTLPTKAEPRHVELAKWLGVVQYVAWKRHHPDSDYFRPRPAGAHVDDLIERWLQESGTSRLVPPERMTAPDFLDRVMANADPRARTAYLLLAVSDQLNSCPLANPLRQQWFEDRLKAIRESDESGLECTADALLALARDILAAERDHARATSKPTLTPVQRVLLLLEQAIPGQQRWDGTAAAPLRETAEAVTTKIFHEARLPHLGFLKTARNRLRKELRQLLEQQLPELGWSATKPLAARLVELAIERREEFADHAPAQAAAEHIEEAEAVVLPWTGPSGHSGTDA
ncbi:type I restriction endonuclease [Streptomyces prasinus]|uniref:type I restriction endonuclease n=1 Tax=Streptomyces prasinus TaxID=67345 RepID=UPI0036AC8458